MKNLSNIIFVFTISLLFTACEKDIDVDFGSFKSQLVINSIFSSDNVWIVDISNSRNILDSDSSIDDVKDADVTITDRESLEELTLFYSDDLKAYTSEQSPNPFGNYRIDVDHPDYISAYAINDIPSKIEVIELDTSIVLFEGEETLKINFNILDNESEDNFYVWDLVEADSDISDILPSTSADLFSDDTNSEAISDQSASGQSKIFIQDHNFNGTVYETSFLSIRNGSATSSNTEPGTGNQNEAKLQLRILTVSKELFEYLKSVETFYRTNSSSSSAVNPVDIKSNVVDGLGIFGAYELTLIDIN